MTGENSVQTVPLSDLQDLPIHSRTISKRLTKNVSATIRSSKKYNVTPIHARRLDGKIYPITDFETVLGLKLVGASSISVIVRDCHSMNEVLADHVDQNFRPQVIDPLKIHEMVKYLLCNNKDMGIDQACKILWLDRCPDLNSVAHLSITEDARKILLEMLEELSEKITFIVTPAYYLKLLAKIIPEKQAEAALEIKSISISHCSAGQLVWPSDDMLKVTLHGFERIGQTSSVEDRISTIGDKEDLKKKQEKTKKQPEGGEEIIAKASKYIAEDPDLIYVPIPGDHPDLLFNRKTGRVAKAEESNETYTMADDLGQVTHLLPDKITKFLGMHTENNLESFHIGNYTTIKRAIKLLSKSKNQDARCSILSRGSLPQR